MANVARRALLVLTCTAGLAGIIGSNSPDTAPKFSLTIEIRGSGTLQVGSTVCSSSPCSGGTYDSGTRVLLNPVPAPGHRFVGYVANSDNDCSDHDVTVSSAITCVAAFEAFPTPGMPGAFTATAGAGQIDLSWTAVTDNSVVSYTLDRAEGTSPPVVLDSNLSPTTSAFRDTTAVPGRQYTYRLVAVNTLGSSPPATATATIVTNDVMLTVQASAGGSVTSQPAGIACPGTCAASYPRNTSVTLTATPAGSFRFDAWGDACAGASPNTVVVLDNAKTCSASFSAVGPSGWVTLAADIAQSLETHLYSSVALDATGRAYIAVLQRVVGGASRLGVRVEAGAVVTTFASLGGGFNAGDQFSASDPSLVLDAAGAPVIAFSMDDRDNALYRWNPATQSWDSVSDRFNISVAAADRPRIARSGNTLVLAWLEAQQIAVRRYDLATGQWQPGAFIPGPTNPADLDLALDSSGLAIVAYTEGPLTSRLLAVRETSPGAWTPLGGEVGVRPGTGPLVLQLGVHVDSADIVRLVWVNGSQNYTLSGASFDGAAWQPLPGKPANLALAVSAWPLRALSVNRDRALFAFAYAWDTTDTGIQSDVFVEQLEGGTLIPVGPLSTRHAQVGSLSLAMSARDRATLVQSHFENNPARPYWLAVRRHLTP
jgi:hypothetical protein